MKRAVWAKATVALPLYVLSALPLGLAFLVEVWVNAWEVGRSSANELFDWLGTP